MPLVAMSNLFGLYGRFDVLVQAMDESLYCAKRPVSIETLRLALERLRLENIPPYPSGYYRAAIGNYLEGHPNVRRIDLFGKLQVKVFLPGYSKDELDQWLRGED
jgi:hypothetical protein